MENEQAQKSYLYDKNPWEVNIEILNRCLIKEEEKQDVLNYPTGEYSDFWIENPGFLDEDHKYYMRKRFHFFLDPSSDLERLIVATEEVDPRSGKTIKTHILHNDFNYMILGDVICEILIEYDGPREVEYATIIQSDKILLELSFPNGSTVKLINESYFKS